MAVPLVFHCTSTLFGKRARQHRRSERPRTHVAILQFPTQKMLRCPSRPAPRCTRRDPRFNSAHTPGIARHYSLNDDFGQQEDADVSWSANPKDGQEGGVERPKKGAGDVLLESMLFKDDAKEIGVVEVCMDPKQLTVVHVVCNNTTCNLHDVSFQGSRT